MSGFGYFLPGLEKSARRLPRKSTASPPVVMPAHPRQRSGFTGRSSPVPSRGHPAAGPGGEHAPSEPAGRASRRRIADVAAARQNRRALQPLLYRASIAPIFTVVPARFPTNRKPRLQSVQRWSFANAGTGANRISPGLESTAKRYRFSHKGFGSVFGPSQGPLRMP